MDSVNLELESSDNVELNEVGEGEKNMEFEVESELVPSNCIYIPQVRPELKPKKGQQFETLEDAKLFYNTYAKEAGFSVRSWSQKKRGGGEDGEIIRKEYVCFKEGRGSVVADIDKQRCRGNLKENCKAMIAVLKSKLGFFVVSVFVEGHSHPLSTPRKVHLLRSHRSVSSAQKCLTRELGIVNIPSHQQFSFLGVQAGGIENIGCTQQDLYNHVRDKRNEMKGHDGGMLLEYFKLEQSKNSSFTFQIESDDENRITIYFWADGTSRRAYNFYRDVVIFDTTYNTNRYGMIFAPLMGVNNHNQTIIFACAFLSDETINSFVWLFKKFLEFMPSDAPKMIITDQDPAMTKAISETLPSTYHRFCSWHILTKISEKLDSVKYAQYYKNFSDCIWKSESKEEFDSKWEVLVEISGLDDNKWLKSMYEIRSRWVPAYVNHVFSAGMSSSQRAESAHAFFKRYVNKKNSLVDFMIQFGRGLARQRHEELKADNKYVIEKPKVKMPYSFLLQMVDVYTCELFFDFQDELWESFLNYRFHLIGDYDNQIVYNVQKQGDDKHKVREVVYDKGLDYASCSCKNFESVGIPCRHLLAYLNKFHDLDKLPNQYILKRWTQSAKCGNVRDDSGIEINDDKSYLMLRSQLVKESLEVVDKALVSVEGIKIYMDALSCALDKINQLNYVDKSVGVTGGESSQIGSMRFSPNYEYVLQELSQVWAKGSGKRLKGGKERALGWPKNQKPRTCRGCGKTGQTHDKRNCPMLQIRSSQCNEGSNPNASVDDDDDYSPI